MTSKMPFSSSRAITDSPLPFEALPSEVSAAVPMELSFTVFPPHPSNLLIVRRKSDGVEREVRAWPDGFDPVNGGQRFRARMPPLALGETVEYSPVLTRAGLVVETLPARSTRGIQGPGAPAGPDPTAESRATMPRYEWASEFLGAFTVRLVDPPESFGPGPDGMHITYYIESGEIRGPRINGKVRGGDWAVLRHDGVVIAESRITYETDDGALLLSR
jgi:hypothetical protein